MSDYAKELKRRFTSHEAHIGVVGLGYVGLPVAVTFAEAGFRVTGIDLREEKVRLIEEGRSHLKDVPDSRLKPLRDSEKLRAAMSFEPLSEADAVIICVPTPISAGAPDLSRVVFAGEELGKVLTTETLVVLESTTYPGTTDELLKPLLEVAGLVVGKHIFLAFSPERIDPGNPEYEFADIPKIVGGCDSAATELAETLYSQVVPKVVVVSGTREAEMAKLIENTFRHVNIALVNELALYSHDLGVDIWEAIESAATKPFGFMPFWPGPGWGGHCIPLDPSYLSWRVRSLRSHEIRFVELAQSIHAEMPRHVLERTSRMLNDTSKSIRGARILCVGTAYKPGTEDTRESPALKIIAELITQGADVSYHDPLVEQLYIEGRQIHSTPLDAPTIVNQDLILILIRQDGVDWHLLNEHARLVFDCCNALKARGPNIKRL